MPILVAGPNLVQELLPFMAGHLSLFYWPTVALLATTAVIFLYALSVPVRTPLIRHLPGALLATCVLVLGSVALRAYLDASFGQVRIYGSLSAPIANVAWLFVMVYEILAAFPLTSVIGTV